MKNLDIKKIARLKFLFVIRKEQDFSVLSSFSLSAGRIFVMGCFIFLLIFGLAILSTKTIFKNWFDPASVHLENTTKILEFSDQIDSLLLEVSKKEQFIANIQTIISGDSLYEEDIDFGDRKSEPRPGPLITKEWSSGSQKIIEEFQSLGGEVLPPGKVNFELSSLTTFFFTPIRGIVSASFDPVNDHFGVDVVGKDNSPVLAIADGTVIMSNWTLKTGYVIGIQHKGDMLSFYKHNSVLLKEIGDVVRGGDIIAIIGNTGDLSTGAHLHFELWYKGSPLNPQEFITFD